MGCAERFLGRGCPGVQHTGKQPIRRLILSATDLSGKIMACRTMACTDSDLNDGLSVNFDSGPRLNYWMVQNDQELLNNSTMAAMPAGKAGSFSGSGSWSWSIFSIWAMTQHYADFDIQVRAVLGADSEHFADAETTIIRLIQDGLKPRS